MKQSNQRENMDYHEKGITSNSFKSQKREKKTSSKETTLTNTSLADNQQENAKGIRGCYRLSNNKSRKGKTGTISSQDSLADNIEEIRKEFSLLLHNINWQSNRGCMPYDWISYGHSNISKLCKLLKVDISDEHLLKKDKRGYWR